MQASFLTSKSDSFAGGIDARVKLSLCAIGSLASLILSSPYSLSVLLLGGFFLALSATRLWTIVRVILFFSFMLGCSLIFTALLSIFIPKLIVWKPLSFAVPYLRMLVVVMVLIALAVSTPVQVVTEKLRSLRLPGVIYIPLSVAIRFIPTFMDDCRQIRDAARLRPSRGFIGMWRGLVVPLVFRMFASADDLSISAELKGLSAGRKAVVPPSTPLSKTDYIIIGIAGCLLIIAIILQIYGPQVASYMPE